MGQVRSKRGGRRAWLFIAVGTACGWSLLVFVLHAANDAVSNYKADVVAQCVADDLWNARQLAKLRSQNQNVRFDSGTSEYVIPVLKAGAVQEESVKLARWPYWASLVEADFGGESSATFNIWGSADKLGQVVIDVAGHRRRIVLMHLGRTTIERLERG